MELKDDISLTSLELLSLNLHLANQKEIQALGFPDTKRALMIFYLQSVQCWTVVHNGEPIMMCGRDSANTFWLMFAAVDSLPLSFFKLIDTGIKKLFEKIPEIHGIIFPENKFAFRLARHYKAEFGAKQLNGFIPFRIWREKLCARQIQGQVHQQKTR